MKTYSLHILRHGLTEGNLKGLYIGHTDMPLCREGKEQLCQMKRDYAYPESSFVFSSPLSRCLETAEILYPGVKPIVIDGLIEYNFGSFDGKDAEELHKKHPLFDSWLAGEKGVAPPFGETNEDFTKRICLAFMKIVDAVLKTGTDNAVIITHGGVMNAILSYFGLPEAAAHEWLAPAGCGYTLRINPTLWAAGKKLEVIKELPLAEEGAGNYYDGWDYYPQDDDDFDVSEYLYDENFKNPAEQTPEEKNEKEKSE